MVKDNLQDEYDYNYNEYLKIKKKFDDLDVGLYSEKELLDLIIDLRGYNLLLNIYKKLL